MFTAALGLSEPWRVTRSELDIERAQLDLYLGCERGARFACPAKDCAHGSCSVHDTVDKTWRHLDFFQHKAFLHARLPRVRCPEHGGRQVSVPWARPGSGFTLLFEALVCNFAAAMPMAKVAQMTREHDTRIWRIVEHHVNAARDQLDCTGVTRVGMDETSARKGQDYVSIFADLDARRVIFATEGRCAETVARFAADLAGHGGEPEKVTDTSSDMSTAFISGIGAHLPNARTTFDRYHLAAKLSEAIDAVRREEVATRPELKHTRLLWLKNHATLSVKQQGELNRLMRPSAQLATARARRLAGGLPCLLRPGPSGHFPAHGAWLLCATIAHNLLRVAHPHQRADRRARAATLRRHLVNVPAQLAHRAHGIVVHLSTHWARRWQRLFQATCRPLPTST